MNYANRKSPLTTMRALYDESAAEGTVVPVAGEIERDVLGCMMTAAPAVPQVIEILGTPELNEMPFYFDANRTIYQAIITIDKRGEPIDLRTVSNELGRKLDEVGGLAYLMQLTAEVVTTANVEAHARILVEHHAARQYVLKCDYMKLKMLMSGPGAVAAMLSEADHQMASISDLFARTKTVRHIGDWSKESLERIDRIATHGGGLTGLRTGLRDLDNLTNGFQRQQVDVVAARPGMGKTALTLNFAYSATEWLRNDETGELEQPNTWCLYFSLEMSALQLWLRLVCAIAKVDMGKVDRAQLANDEWVRIIHAVETLKKLRIYVDDTPGLTFEEIRAKTRKLQQQLDPGKKMHGEVIIDYMGLVALPPGMKRWEGVGDNSDALLKLAKECDITVIPCVQLSREIGRAHV